MLAVIKTGGKQYIVKEKQTLKIEKLPASQRTKDKVVFSDVLLVAQTDSKVTVGTPIVAKVKVAGTVLKDGKHDKVRVVKYKAKTRYKRVNGHRQPFTEVRIDSITA